MKTTWTPALFTFVAALALPAFLLPGNARAADVAEARLRALEVRQDSMFTLLKTMAAQAEFVALRVGWKPPADTAPVKIPIGKSFSKGSAKPTITLVEFSDLQCPYCAQLAPVLDKVVKDYPGEVRLVFKHFPLSFHSQARAAAAAGIAAGNQGKFFEFRAKVSPKFRELNESVYLTAAQELGLDMAKFRREMALTPEVNKILDDDMELGRTIGVEGTPTVFVNGRLAEDRSYEYFAGLIEQARKKK
jgi:protein-disulfide isomerase